jgi:hypothetical protein
VKVQASVLCAEIRRFVYGYRRVALGNIISSPFDVKMEAGDFGERLVTCIMGTYKTTRYKSLNDHNLKSLHLYLSADPNLGLIFVIFEVSLGVLASIIVLCNIDLLYLTFRILLITFPRRLITLFKCV